MGQPIRKRNQRKVGVVFGGQPAGELYQASDRLWSWAHDNHHEKVRRFHLLAALGRGQKQPGETIQAGMEMVEAWKRFQDIDAIHAALKWCLEYEILERSKRIPRAGGTAKAEKIRAEGDAFGNALKDLCRCIKSYDARMVRKATSPLYDETKGPVLCGFRFERSTKTLTWKGIPRKWSYVRVMLVEFRKTDLLPTYR